jgi:hypothetical protein
MGSGYEIARAVQFCISNGHLAREAWGYTPRQLAAWSELIHRQQAGRDAQVATLLRVVRGEGKEGHKAYMNFVKKLTEESK